MPRTMRDDNVKTMKLKQFKVKNNSLNDRFYRFLLRPSEDFSEYVRNFSVF